jgi:hypothetical protein
MFCAASSSDRLFGAVRFVNKYIYLASFTEIELIPSSKKIPQLVAWTTLKTEEIGYDENINY